MNRCCEGEGCRSLWPAQLLLGRQAGQGGFSFLCLVGSLGILLVFYSASGSIAGDFLVLPHLSYPQFSAMDALAGMMMKGAAKCDKHAE